MFKNPGYPRQDELTHEWYWNGKWYDRYPAREVEDAHEAYQQWQEGQFEERRINRRENALVKKVHE